LKSSGEVCGFIQVCRVKRDIQKVIEAIKAGFALPELKVEMDALQAHKEALLAKNSSARTRAWKLQRCSVG
jgi:hypothetical protein